MKDYCGIKFIRASVKTVTKAEYCKIRGWDVPAHEDPNEEGVLVEYPDSKKNHPDYDGYISWSPLNVFQAAYRENGRMTFGAAVEAAKLGKKVSRIGWNGYGMFAYIVPEASYPAQTGAAKAHFGEGSLVPYRAYWALKTAQGDVATLAPSGSDSLAEDWVILD